MMSKGIFHFGCVWRQCLLFIASFCWVGSCISAQPARLDFRHYTIDEGLPSSEVYTTFEDRDGFIWFGTDNGVARFDGYEFTVFDADDGLEDPVVFTIMEDPGGKLWVSTYSGRIYYFAENEFHPYEHNDITTTFKKNNTHVVLLDAKAAGELIVGVKPYGFIKISSRGIVEALTGSTVDPDGYSIYKSQNTIMSAGTGRVHAYSNPSRIAPDPDSRIVKLRVLKADGTDETIKFRVKNQDVRFSIWQGSVWTRSGTDREEVIMASRTDFIVVPTDGGPVQQFPMGDRVVNLIIPGKGENDYWACYNRGAGIEHLVIHPGEVLPRTTSFLEGHSVSSGFFDRNGGFWVTTLDDGIYYCPYPEQKLYLKPDGNESAKSISLALTGPKNFYSGYDDGTLYRYDVGDENLRNVLSPEITESERMFDVFYDTLHKRVYTSTLSFEHDPVNNNRLKKNDVVHYSSNNYSKIFFDNFNYLPRSHPNKLFASRGFSYGLFDLRDQAVLDEVWNGHAEIIGTHVMGISLDGKMLLGTLHGLFKLNRDGEMIPDNLGVEELSGRIVYIKHVHNYGMLFGTRGYGLVYLDRDTSFQIQKTDGLASDMVRNIHEDSKGDFWVSTLNGISKVSFSRRDGSYKIRTFRTENGLPTNEISQAKTWGEEVWLATSVGIVHFNPPALDTVSASPTIRKITVNGEEPASSESYDLPAGKQDVSINFGSINYLLGSQIRYRYRITPDAPWQYSTDRTANYPNLGAGTYRFSVQSMNQDGYWSARTVVDIFIATPWYAAWWFWVIVILFLFGTLIFYFLVRERRRKREQELLIQINELEHAALHAQMNPHFVFNALNSIQNFVLKNDAKQAATYLSRFASIIRQTLRSSVEGKHSLREEVDMLNTYLVLEKLRFKDGFSYDLTVDPLLPLDTIDLPPLLIQPFVENAIVHGLKERQGGGLISIDFSGSSEFLNVRIEDNGKGFDPTENVKNDSLGMDITRRRLAMMNRDMKKTSGMVVEPRKDRDGNLCGTRVTLNIKLKHKVPADTR